MPYLDDVLNPYQSLTGDLTTEDTLTGLLSEDGLLQGALAISDVVGVTELTELTDVSITNPLNNDVLTYNEVTEKWENMPAQGGGGGGTSDYEDLDNKPSINSVTLTGNKTTAELNISYNDLDDKPTIPTELDDLSDVDTTGASNGLVLTYRNGTWEPKPLPQDLPPNVEDLSNFESTPAMTAGQVLKLSQGAPVTEWTNGFVSYNELTDTPSLATVATSGSYDDLTDKPTIPDITTVDVTSQITVTKNSGNWSINTYSAYRSGNVVTLYLKFEGNGTPVNAGSNAFQGSVSGIKPVLLSYGTAYISSSATVAGLWPTGGITVRVTGANVTLGTGNTSEFSITYITNN